MKVLPMVFGESWRGVYHIDLEFTEATVGLPGVGLAVHVSNIPGNNMEFIAAYSSPGRLETSQLVVIFSGGGCAGGSPLMHQGSALPSDQLAAIWTRTARLAAW